MDVSHNAYTEQSFEAAAHERIVELPGERIGQFHRARTLVLSIHTAPRKDNHGIPADTIKVNMGIGQARQVAESLDQWLRWYDGDPQ